MTRRPDVLHGKTSRRRLTTVGMTVAVSTWLAVQMVTAQGVADGTAMSAPTIRTSVLLPGDTETVDSSKVGETESAPPPPVPERRFGSASNHLTIVATFDSTITGSTNAAAIQNTINTAIALFESKILDPITVTINFKGMTSGLGASNTSVCAPTYSSFIAALRADAKSADDATAMNLLQFATINPVNGSSTINVKSANLKAIGITGCAATLDGTISLNLSSTNPGNAGSTLRFNLLPVVEHEIDEVLGLGSALPNPPANTIFPEDLFRYKAASTRSFAGGGNAFFSIDGLNSLAQFHNPAINDGLDYGDWEDISLTGASPKVQDASATPGSNPTLGVELTALDVIGFDTVASTVPNGRPDILTDRDGDGKGDVTVFRASSGTWFTLLSSTGFTSGTAGVFGLPGDLPVPGDYDGDGKSDLAVYRPGNGTWYLQFSSTGASVAYVWGLGVDVPVPGDYDGDGRTDLAVYHPATGVWLIATSSSSYQSSLSIQWGSRIDIPVPSDYDGDGKTDVAVFRPSNGTWYVRKSSSAGATSLTLQWGGAGDVPVPGDYDGDNLADVAVYRPSSGTWFIRQSTTGFTTSVSYQWGAGGDVPVATDYDGDGKADIAVFRPSSGTWFISRSSTGFATSAAYQWGAAGDIATPNLTVMRAIAISHRTVANVMRNGDLDGDGRADVTVFRPATGQWFTLRSGTNFTTVATFQWGVIGDIPVPGDFDGDGATDVVVFRPSSGTWFILTSGSNFTASAAYRFGGNGDTPVLGDFDGDGRADLAVFRPSSGTWFILTSGSNFTASTALSWGLSSDLPVPGDYDGDGITDLTVYRPSTGTWFIKTSSSGFAGTTSLQWGVAGDIAVPGDFDGDGRTDFGVYRPSTGAWFVRLSSTGYATSASYQWGIAGDIPVPGDFDGDGTTDLAVWRPSTSTWFIRNSRFTTSTVLQWGATSDVPILRRP